MTENDDKKLTGISKDYYEIIIESERKKAKDDLYLLVRGMIYGVLIMVLGITPSYILRAIIEGV